MQALFMMMLTVILLSANCAVAQDVAAIRCQAVKQQAIGRYLDCRMAAEARFTKVNQANNYFTTLARCDAKLRDKFAAVEKLTLRRGSVCPSEQDSDHALHYLGCTLDTAVTTSAGAMDYPLSCVY